ncbi:hypothetical protein [Aureimonas jatrophae]|uniref:Uncharacterized protein n=1 Tax=Aureimonas jatrophae TaxID=1166073 RepID=A0A1H0N099_9HYPH|nr:hypothetical protein [Aureimonas jatrophae]MBB3952978.1 hypothetical protein [Aureimonas jatrophae]SDO86052.1 hypothetical protein SAMN05192530_11635 [Aureimonas jatrophae]
MTDPTDPKAPLVAPGAHPKRDAARALIEAAAGTNPVTGAFARLYQTTHPSKTAQERASWEAATTDRVNEHGEQLDRHEDLLAPKQTITGLPAQLIARLVQDCPDGLGMEFYDREDLCALFPDEAEQVVEDAVYDLKSLGLVRSFDRIGAWSIAIEEDTYRQLDAQLMGWDTDADAVEVAQLMLAGDTGHARTLHEQTGWPKRRFNPAFRSLLPLFPAGRVSRECQADYPTSYVALVAEDKAALRRFLAAADAPR